MPLKMKLIETKIEYFTQKRWSGHAKQFFFTEVGKNMCQIHLQLPEKQKQKQKLILKLKKNWSFLSFELSWETL